MAYEIIKILDIVFIGFAVLVALTKWGIVIVYIISGSKKGFDGDTEIPDESDGDCSLFLLYVRIPCALDTTLHRLVGRTFLGIGCKSPLCLVPCS